eukprot:4376246-Pyramimonas_sp.AAC.1
MVYGLSCSTGECNTYHYGFCAAIPLGSGVRDALLATLSLGTVRLDTGCSLNGFGGSCIHGLGF